MNTKPPTDKTSSQSKIIAAARKLMTDKGVKQTTLADVAREAGISRGTLFYYYASKSDLIYDILEKHLSDLTDAIFASLSRRRNTTDLAAALQNALNGLIVDENSGRMNLYLLQEAIIENSALRDRFAVKYQTWRELIASHASRVFGISDAQQLSALGTLLLAMIDGLTIQYLLAPKSVNFQDVARQLVRMIADGEQSSGRNRPEPHH